MTGASASQTGLSQAEPEVSPLRASIPSADKLPRAAAGHWASDEGWEIAKEYLPKRREDLMMGDLTDFELANAQYLVGRESFQLLAYQTAAKERIRWLSVQLASAIEARRAETPESDSVEDESAVPQGDAQ
jgi:hypothetical protein